MAHNKYTKIINLINTLAEEIEDLETDYINHFNIEESESKFDWFDNDKYFNHFCIMDD